MADQGRQVILGAGPIGHALHARLVATGVEASLWSIMGDPTYDMPGTHPEPLDGTDAEAVAAACADARVVYLLLNAHYVDWYERFPPRLEAAIVAAAAASATLVYHDNLYAYGPSAVPLTEDHPADATTRKGRLRADMAALLMAALAGGRVSGVIGRSADMYGPGALNSAFDSTLGQRHFYPLLAGKPINALGDIEAPHAYAYVDDVARDLIVLGTTPDALGQVWHLPAAQALSHRALLELAGRSAGVEAKVRGSRVSGYVVKALGRFQPDVGEVAEMLYQFEQPLLVSHQRFADAFGAQPTPHEEAMARTLEWYRANPQWAS